MGNQSFYGSILYQILTFYIINRLHVATDTIHVLVTYIIKNHQNIYDGLLILHMIHLWSIILSIESVIENQTDIALAKQTAYQTESVVANDIESVVANHTDCALANQTKSAVANHIKSIVANQTDRVKV